MSLPNYLKSLIEYNKIIYYDTIYLSKGLSNLSLNSN